MKVPKMRFQGLIEKCLRQACEQMQQNVMDLTSLPESDLTASEKIYPSN